MKNKGFTLVEIIAVIVILGIIATISIAGVSNIIKSSKERYYEKQEDLVIVAGKTYYADHRSKLPYEIGTISSVNVSTLVEEKYIEPVVDVNKHACSSDTSKVYVQKVTDEEYRYWGYLECSGADYKSSKDTEKPKIFFTPNNTTGKIKTTLTVKMSVTDNEKIASYRYVITKDGVEYKDSGYKEYTKDINIVLNNTGTYQIKGYAYDSSGNQTQKTSGIYEIEITKPDCNNITVTTSKNKNTWVNTNITVSVAKNEKIAYYTIATNENGEGYKNKIKNSTKNRSITISAEGHTKVRVKAYNEEGQSCTAVNGDEFLIDKTKPKVSVVVSGINLGGGVYGINGSNWPIFTPSCTDQGKYQSGIANATVSAGSYTLPSISWGSISRGMTVYANCQDNAGNKANQASKNVSVKYYSRHSSCEVELYIYGQNRACGSYWYIDHYYNCHCWDATSSCSDEKLSGYSCESSASASVCSSGGYRYYCKKSAGCDTCPAYAEFIKSCRTESNGVELYKQCYHY